MSRVITFSTKFPKGHYKAGQPTFFVEKIIKGFGDEAKQRAAYTYGWECAKHAIGFEDSLETFGVMSDVFLRNLDAFKPKRHTIRAGNRWREGDIFSPRIWSGRPRASKQIAFSTDLWIKKVYPFEMYPAENDAGASFKVNGWFLPDMDRLRRVAENDGLSVDDFIAWMSLNELPFIGQIICWDDSIRY